MQMELNCKTPEEQEKFSENFVCKCINHSLKYLLKGSKSVGLRAGALSQVYVEWNPGSVLTNSDILGKM
jgi:hypothetical protein